jgi:excisionase family DNA binding protein
MTEPTGLLRLVPEARRALDPTDQPRLVLTVEEAAQRLCISRTVMYALVSSGAVRSIRIGRLRRVPADALSEFVHQLEAQQQ